MMLQSSSDKYRKADAGNFLKQSKGPFTQAIFVARYNQLQFQCDLSAIWLEFLWNMINFEQRFCISEYIHVL